MGIFARLSHKIGDNLVRSNVIKEEDAEIYIYGINQIFVSVLNVSSALIIGLIFDMFLESIIFIAAYIPLRSFAGGYHAKTPVRCYILSLIMITVVLAGMKYLPVAEIVCYAVLLATVSIVILLSPVEDKNKPLDKIEQKMYKRRAMLITTIELVIGFELKLLGVESLFVAMTYSFTALCFILIAGRIKNFLMTE